MTAGSTSAWFTLVLLRVVQHLHQAVSTLTPHTLTTTAVQTSALPGATATASILRVTCIATAGSAGPLTEAGVVQQGAFCKRQAAGVKDTIAGFVRLEHVVAAAALIVVAVGAQAALALVVEQLRWRGDVADKHMDEQVSLHKR